VRVSTPIVSYREKTISFNYHTTESFGRINVRVGFQVEETINCSI